MPPFLPTKKIQQILCNGVPASDWALDGYLYARQTVMAKRGWTKDWTMGWTKELDLGSSILRPLDLTSDAKVHNAPSPPSVPSQKALPGQHSAQDGTIRRIGDSIKQLQARTLATRSLDSKSGQRGKRKSMPTEAVHSQQKSKAPRLQNAKAGSKSSERALRRKMDDFDAWLRDVGVLDEQRK